MYGVNKEKVFTLFATQEVVNKVGKINELELRNFHNGFSHFCWQNILI